MSTKIQDIQSTNWQLSNKFLGAIAQGSEEIMQCVSIILTTDKGSDPLRPLFGSDIWKFIDTPTNTAAPNIAAEIIDCIGKWEQRIIIRKIEYNIAGSRIDFELFYELLESGEVTEMFFYVSKSLEAGGRNFSNGFTFGFN